MTETLLNITRETDLKAVGPEELVIWLTHLRQMPVTLDGEIKIVKNAVEFYFRYLEKYNDLNSILVSELIEKNDIRETMEYHRVAD